MSLTDSVRAGLDQLGEIDARDAAVVDLALGYADAIDSGAERLVDAGPKLLAALTALRMTPAARAAVVKTEPAGAPRSPLDELRARRAARTAGP